MKLSKLGMRNLDMIRLGNWWVFDKNSPESKSTGDGDIEPDIFKRNETLLRDNNLRESHY